MTDEQKKLVRDNTGLVGHIAKKYVVTGRDSYDDLFQEGCVYLCQAARGFKPEMGYSFSTYAGSMVEGGLKTWKRKKAMELHGMNYPRKLQDVLFKEGGFRPEFLSLDCPVGENVNGRDMTAHDVVSNVDMSFDDVEVVELARSALGRLKVSEPAKEMLGYVLDVYKADGEAPTQAELVEKFGFSQSYCSRVLRAWCAEIKATFGEV